MASQTTVVFLLLSIIIGVLAISATARPCKTIFFITSTSSSFPTTTADDSHPNHPQLTFFITEIHRTTSSFYPDSSTSSSSNDAVSVSSTSSSSSSVRDISLDILSVVGSLLFGVGCGALTAVTLFLITRRNASDDEDESEDEDEGYAAIPTKEVPPSADEIDAMKA